jgi:hypothetical protein
VKGHTLQRTWWRGQQSNIVSGWDMNKTDALAFTTKTDCVVLGYGIIAPKDAATPEGWTMKVRCVVNDKEVVNLTFTSRKELREDNVYKCIFKDHNGKQIELKANDKFEIEQTLISGPKGNHFEISSCTAQGIDN